MSVPESSGVVWVDKDVCDRGDTCEIGPMSASERSGAVGVPQHVLQSEPADPAREPSRTPTLKVWTCFAAADDDPNP